MKLYRQFAVIALASVVADGPRVIADQQSWVGEKVLNTKPAKQVTFGVVVNGRQVYFDFSGIGPFTVRDDRDGWLRIFDGHREGWAPKADFVLARDAPAYFHRRVQANPQDYWALFMRGRGWFDKGEPDNAIKDFTECIRLDPTDAAAFNNRGNAWFDKKEYDRAIREYDEAIRLDPGYAMAFNNRGNAWFDKKEYDRAIRDFDEAIRLDPAYPNPFGNRGKAWAAKKEYDPAICDIDAAIRLDPTYAGGHFIRSVTQMLDRRPNAENGFRRVLDLQGWSGDWSTYAVILGHLAARQERNDSQASWFLTESAGRLDEKWPYPVVQFLRGDIDEARLLALAVDDDKRTDAHCYLGMSHALAGRRTQALDHFRWVKDHGNPDATEYTIAVAELDRLERGASSLPLPN